MRKCISYILAMIFLWAGKGNCTESISNGSEYIKITSKASLVHIGSIDSLDLTEKEDGKRAAKRLLSFFEDKDKDFARAALKIYEKIIPKERLGGASPALAWFCEFLASDKDQEKFLEKENTYAKSYFRIFADNDFALLKEYLKHNYRLEKIGEQDAEKGPQYWIFLEDLVMIGNPKRESWEKISKIIGVLNLKEGDTIADIGCGPGYYAFKFMEIVGEKGHVYAIDINDKHLNYISSIINRHKIPNITTIHSKLNDICLDNKVDAIFMCSLYHIIYACSTEKVKDEFIDSIKKALQEDGTFIVVDNALVQNTELPYQGPYIAKELIIAQLKYYGFHLVDYYQFIPQRYVLIFKMDDDSTKTTEEGKERK